MFSFVLEHRLPALLLIRLKWSHCIDVFSIGVETGPNLPAAQPILVIHVCQTIDYFAEETAVSARHFILPRLDQFGFQPEVVIVITVLACFECCQVEESHPDAKGISFVLTHPTNVSLCFCC